MPEGITVFAKWRQIQYRVFLHPNAVDENGDPDSTLDWGSDSVSMCFRVSYGEKISEPKGIRQRYDGEKRNPWNEMELVGWYLDEGLSSVFMASTALTEATVSAAYDKATDFTDTIDKWGNLSNPKFNTDVDRFWINNKFELYAKWRAITPGADGIGIIYDDVDGSDAPTDNLLYQDTAKAIAQGAATAPEGQRFLYWVVQKWNGDNAGNGSFEDTDIHVLPGNAFEVKIGNAKCFVYEYEQAIDPDTEEPLFDETTGEPIYTDTIKTADYTIQLRAEYGQLDPPAETYIKFWANNGTNEVEHHTKLMINEAIDIPTQQTFTNGEIDESTRAVPTPTGLSNNGMAFLGWAKLDVDDNGKPVTTGPQPDELTEANLFLKWVEATDSKPAHYEALDSANNTWVPVTQVAADEFDPYQDLYAVWTKCFYVYHTGTCSVERYMLADNTTGFSLTELVDTTKYLYGGYYADYTGKSADFEASQMDWRQAASTMSTTIDVSKVAVASDAGEGKGKAYSVENIASCSFTDPYTEAGTSIAPENGTVYFLKEVPIDSYLLPKLKYTCKNFGDKDFGTAWLMSDIDVLDCYTEVGFRIGDKYYQGTADESLTITPIHNEGNATTVTAANFKSGITGAVTYLIVYNNPEGGVDNPGAGDPSVPYELIPDGAEVSQYWVTPDGLTVVGKTVRIYTFTYREGTRIILGKPAPTCKTVADHTASEILSDVTTEDATPDALTRDYYLMGWINDAAYGDEGDAANIGEYKFPKETGRLTATFTANTWVGVKTGDNGEWYWAPTSSGGITGTTGNLYKANGNTQKMQLPVGVELTLTLTEMIDANDDVYGVTLSYTTNP